MIRYGALLMASWLSRTIPRHIAYWVSLRIADLYFVIDRQGREAVMANLRQVMAFRGRHPTERELRLTTRTTFHFFGKYLVDFFRFQSLDEAEIQRLVTIENPEYIEEAWRHGTGVITVTAHLGNWEIGGAVLAGLGYPINAVALRQPSVKLNEFFQRHRRARGMNVIPLGSSVKRLVAALKRGEFVALLADRDYSDHRESTAFCGLPACLPRGAAWLAARTGAVVVPGFVLRQEDDRFLMKMFPPILASEACGEREIQRRIVETLEEIISAYPHQWFMFQKVWTGRGYGVAGS